MNLLQFLFGGDLSYRLDIEELKAKVASTNAVRAESQLTELYLTKQIEALQTRVGELNLVVEGLLRVLAQNGMLVPEQFAELLKEIDSEDGKHDGQRRASRSDVPERYPKCDARIPSTHTYCQFCGERFDDTERRNDDRI